MSKAAKAMNNSHGNIKEQIREIEVAIEASPLSERLPLLGKISLLWRSLDMNKAEESAAIWYDLALRQGSVKEQIRAGRALYSAKHHLGFRSEARQGFHDLLDKAKANDLVRQSAGICNHISQTYNFEDRQAVVDWQLKAVAFARESEHNSLLSTCLANLAVYYAMSEDYDTAYSMVGEALQIARQAGLLQHIVNAHLRCYSICAGDARLEEASSHLEEAQLYNNQLANVHNQLEIDYSWMELHYLKGQYEKCIQSGLALDAGPTLAEDRIQHIATYQKMGESFIALSRWKEAGQILHKALELRDENNHLMGIEILSLLEKVHLAVENYPAAYECLRDRAQCEQAYNELKKSQAMSRLQVKFATERKERENEMLKNKLQLGEKITAQNRQLKELNDTKDKFFTIIANNIRSPIIALEGVGREMNLCLKKGEKEQMMRLSERVDSTAKRLNNLLDNLLNWALLQQGVIPYRPEQLNLKSLVMESCMMFEHLASLKNIDLQSDIDTGLSILADESSFKTILRNLISNAIKFSDQDTTVHISAKLADEQVQVCIIDKGKGMDTEQLSQLFSLNRNGSATGQEEQGTGLGLVLIRELVQLNRGELKVSSKLDQGSTFCVILPSSHAQK